MTYGARVRPGSPQPLGAVWNGHGTNFALYSESATGVDLCLFDAAGKETRIAVRSRTEFVWHVFVEAVGPGQLYGYRVDGPWAPKDGLRFNPHGVLLDPYAKALSGTQDWSKGGFSYDVGGSGEDRDLVRADTEQRAAPLGVVVDPSFDWGDDAPPNVPMRKSLIYEAHVKGMTARHPDVPPELRGTYLGLASEPILEHLRELGVTSIELLPVHGFIDDAFLLDRGLRNYWGYNSIAFFAPDVRYRAGSTLTGEVGQFKRMVKAMHAAGIEVILDVVYNHTAEGNHLGPTLSFKGIDNPTYYRLVPEDHRYYFDYTGTGNSLNVRHPQTLRLIMDSLRYWVEEMHVDGFRFDLAAALARSLHEVDRLSSFFSVIHQDPILSSVKLIAEPWDVGDGGYQVGQFPVRWAEWNGKYRDTMRAFWRGDGGSAADLGYRLTGSADLYQNDGRRPSASINFITAHDGFTLADLASYDHKHNDANGEDNRDGANDNASWNSGTEGDTDDPSVLALRRRRIRNFLATLLLSQGTPMLCGGDEIGRTQRGNNNAYCQDNEISWLDWDLNGSQRSVLDFVKRLVRIRHEHPLIRRGTFFRGREIRGVGVRDLVWFRHDGEPMTDEDWQNPGTSSLGMFAAGSGLEAMDEQGHAQSDDDLALLVNASGLDLDFIIPAFVDRGRAIAWELLLDTTDDDGATGIRVDAGSSVKLASHSLKLFSRRAVGVGGLQTVHGAPVSTYRLQLHAGFGFKDALAVVGYLDDLGVGGLYVSPCLRARRGSLHGYDVVDHSVLNPELGTDDDHRALSEALVSRGLRHVLDFVPNHVGIGSGENAWWLDVLENGPSSTYADSFDIEWDPPAAAHARKVLLPILGQQFGAEVDDAKIDVVFEEGAVFVEYYGTRLPASPRSYLLLLDRALGQLDLAEADPLRGELESIRSAVSHLPPASSTRESDREERAREKEIVKRRLLALCRKSTAVDRGMRAAAAAIAASPARLERFLGDQNYRLSYWRVAAEEINYRRFFDINDLAAIRMEDPEVFAAAHVRLFELIAQGRVTGIRLDHTDGLYDPYAYFQALRQGARDALRRAGVEREQIYTVAEKVLETGENLPRSWAISGTVGYDFLGAVNGLWVDGAAEGALMRAYVELARGSGDFRAVLRDAKRDVVAGFASEVHALSRALKRIAERTRHARDFTLASLVRVITEVIVAFPVYRSYVRPDGSRERNDEAHIGAAIARARRRCPMIEGSTFEFLESALLLREPSAETVRFTMRFQQLTGPIMAKGMEDTTLYRFTRLACLNEVGCDAGRFGESARDFHAHNASILAEWPLSMTTTSTHDTKRSEDVRARIAVFSEMPDEWTEFARDMGKLCAPFATTVDAEPAPTPADAYLFYQTVVGAYPFEGSPDAQRGDFTDRMAGYMGKAIHEAKVSTSWTAPNAAYDRAVDAFVRGALASRDVTARIVALVERVSSYGACNSLAQLALRLASPGVPDIYQGCEMWDLSLVDPDSRRPVDFAIRRNRLAELRARPVSPNAASELVRTFGDGRIKLYTTHLGLRLRRELPALFLDAAYRPVEASEHVVAFERSFRGQRLVCVVPRLGRKLSGGRHAWPLGDAWGSARIELSAPGHFENVFTGERFEGASLPMAAVLGVFPVAWLLERSPAPPR
jgi:isoamylase